MIDPNIERMYDIILSMFLGLFLVLLFDRLFEKPRIVNVYMDENNTKQKLNYTTY